MSSSRHLRSSALLLGLVLSLVSYSKVSARPCAPLPLSEEVKQTGSLSYQVRSPEPDSATAPIVIALHGLGHHKRGFSKLAERLPKGWRVISVDAPWRYGRGFAWYRYRCPEAEADLQSSTARLLSLVAQVTQRYPKAPKPAIFGFSQGGVMSLSALNSAPERWSAVASLSGYWLPSSPPRSAKRAHPPLMMAHGAQDRVVSFARGQLASERFGTAGYTVSWVPFEGGHTVSREAFGGLTALLTETFNPPRDLSR